MNFRLASGETAHVLDDSRPRVFVHDAAVAAIAGEALALAATARTSSSRSASPRRRSPGGRPALR